MSNSPASSVARPPHDPGLARIAVQRIDIPGRWLVIPVDHVAYAFLSSAVRTGVIEAPDATARCLARSAVYIRSIKGSLFRTGFSNLEALRRTLDTARFVTVHRLVIVNVSRLVELDLAGRVSRVGVMAGTQIEFIPLSRRCLRAIRELVGLPPRVQRFR